MNIDYMCIAAEEAKLFKWVTFWETKYLLYVLLYIVW